MDAEAYDAMYGASAVPAEQDRLIWRVRTKLPVNPCSHEMPKIRNPGNEFIDALNVAADEALFNTNTENHKTMCYMIEYV